MATAVATELQGRLVEVELSGVAESAATACAAESSKAFRGYDPDQVLLLSPVLADWVPQGDLAHFVSDLVEDVLDLSAIYASYEEVRGYPPYDPRLMVKLLVYGYSNGVCSSRKLERATHRDVAIWMLGAGQHPDYRSIARFRAGHLDALSELLVQTLRLCSKAGLVKFGSLALGGTKLRANASRRKAMSYERVAKKESQLEAEITGLHARARPLLAEAEATDAAEDELYGADVRGDELPAELARRETRLAKLREAKAALEAEAKQRERLAAKRCALRADSRVSRPAGVTRLRPRRPRSATSPIRTPRS